MKRGRGIADQTPCSRAVYGGAECCWATGNVEGSCIGVTRGQGAPGFVRRLPAYPVALFCVSRTAEVDSVPRAAAQKAYAKVQTLHAGDAAGCKTRWFCRPIL